MLGQKHSTSVVTSTGQLANPYASRTSRATLSTDYPASMHRSMTCRSPYSPLTDPHLKQYFRNKLISGLGQSSRTTPTPYGIAPNARSLSGHNTPLSYSYKVTVSTGSCRHSGTSSKVFVTLVGGKGKIVRQRLTKGGQREFTFKPGSLETFQLRGSSDIGDLNYIVVENEGIREADGWFLDSVWVTNEQGGRWVCRCNQWLSLHQFDCQLQRTCKARPRTPAPSHQPTPYTLEVHTGNVRGAGTTANVFVTLLSMKGSSGKTKLSGVFDRGSVVATSVLCESDLGRLKEITVEHDNSGFGPDWFLDYVVLMDTNEETKLFFHSAQWFSRSEGDGKIQRTLHANLEPPEPFVDNIYIVTVQTGNLRGAGTDANVYITLYGSKGSSEQKRLDNDPTNFERGKNDVFSVHCCDLGELSKVKVRHDNTGINPGWFLERVTVAYDSFQVYFECGRWLEMCDGCGGVVEVKLTAGEQKSSEAKQDKETYRVKVHTGNRSGAGTSANVYLVVYGCHGNSGRLWLSSGGCVFQRGIVDEFEVTAHCNVGDLDMVRVGHDNSGDGPGWFLDKVVINCMNTNTEWELLCGRWLCMDSDDGRIERELHPLVAAVDVKSGSKWTVHMYTSDIRGAGTDANVTLQVHGSHGDSGVIPLGDGITNFEQGEHDTFNDIPVCGDVGNVESVTVSHDGSRPYPEWHLHKVVLVNDNSGEEYHYLCDRWLKAGDNGVGAKIKLTANQHLPKPDESLTANEINLSADCEITNEESSLGQSWVNQTGSSYSYRDQCRDSSITNQYIKQLKYDQMSSLADMSDDVDGKRLHSVDFHTIPYTVHVVSGAPPVCDHTPFLIITLVGSARPSQPIRLERIDAGQFIPGKPDTFSVESENVGHITSLKVILEAPLNCSPWLIEEISVHSPTLGHTYHFVCGRGLHPGQEYDMEVVDQLLMNTRSTLTSSPQAQDTGPGLVAYEVKVFTADKKHAGTRNNLHLILVGDTGTQSRPLVIKNRSSMFQRGQTDTFQIAIPPIGTLKAIKLAHSPGKGRQQVLDGVSEWYLFQVLMTGLTNKEKFSFLCRRWIPESSSTLSYVDISRTD